MMFLPRNDSQVGYTILSDYATGNLRKTPFRRLPPDFSVGSASARKSFIRLINDFRASLPNEKIGGQAAKAGFRRLPTCISCNFSYLDMGGGL